MTIDSYKEVIEEMQMLISIARFFYRTEIQRRANQNNSISFSP
jgi:hypothetical protein